MIYGKYGELNNTFTFVGEIEGTTQLENYPQQTRQLPLKESTITLRRP